MGQIKELLDFLFIDDLTIFPDDLDLTYEEWIAQKQQEKLAYEEMLSDNK
jgi:hypothetical protein